MLRKFFKRDKTTMTDKALNIIDAYYIIDYQKSLVTEHE